MKMGRSRSQYVLWWCWMVFSEKVVLKSEGKETMHGDTDT